MNIRGFIDDKFIFFRTLPISIKILTFSSFIFALASFMVTPYLGIYLHNSLKIDMELIGFIIATFTFIQFGGGVIGGIIANKFGLKNTMILALLIRTLGLFLITVSHFGLAITIAGIVFIALGSAFYMPSNKAYMVSNVPKLIKSNIMSISRASFTAGMAIGPLLAAFLVNSDAIIMFYALGVLFFVLMLIHHFFILTDIKVNDTQSKGMSQKQKPISWIQLASSVKQPLFFTFTFKILWDCIYQQ